MPETPEWLRSPGLTRSPDALAAVDQLVFLNGLREWAGIHLPFPLTNDRVAELLLDLPISVIESWRTNPASKHHRAMPLRHRMLLIYRMLDLAIRPGWDYSSAEIEFLRSNYGKLPTHAIAANLGRSPGAVRKKAGALGITPPGSTKYSPAEIELINRNYASSGAIWLAEQLGREPGAIRSQASRMGISGRRGRPRRNDA